MWIIVYTVYDYVANISAKKEKKSKNPRLLGPLQV